MSNGLDSILFKAFEAKGVTAVNIEPKGDDNVRVAMGFLINGRLRSHDRHFRRDVEPGAIIGAFRRWLRKNA